MFHCHIVVIRLLFSHKKIKELKNMKKVSLLVALMLAIFSVSFAQTATAQTPVPPEKTWTKGDGGGHRGEGLKKKLGLTDDQAAKLKATHADFKAQGAAIRANTSLSKDDRKSQMAALKTSRDQAIQGILTPTQFTQYTQMLEQGKEKMKEKRMEKKQNKN